MGETNSELKVLKKIILKFWPILVIILLVTIFAFPCWAKGLIPFPSTYLVTFFPPWQHYYGMPVKNNAMPDVITQIFPWRHLVIESWKKWQVPLWNPNNFSGSPLLANYQSAAFHPLNFLFFFLSEVDAWSILIILQFLLAGIFTYFFTRTLKLSRMAALLSAISFMFCGFIVCWGAYGTLSYALIWLPLICWGIQKNFPKFSAVGLGAISLGLAASFFSGHFQTSLYVLFFSFSWLIYKWIKSRDNKQFFPCLLFLIFGLGLAGIQILPTLEFYHLSPRSKLLNISEIVPWKHLITLIAPDFYGNPVTRNDWFGHYAEWAGFAGVVPLILASYLILRSRKSPRFFFFLVALTSLILTRPTPLLDLIIKLRVPVLSSSAASRIIGLFSFSVAILGGFGLDELKKDLQNKNFRPSLVIFGSFLGIVFLIWLILFFGKPFETKWLLVAKRNFVLPTGIVAGLFGTVVAFRLISGLFKNKSTIWRLEPIVFLIPLFLTTFDMLRFATKWFPFDPPKYFYPSLPVLDFLTKNIGYDRVSGFFGMEMMNYYQIQGFSGYDPLYIKRYGELMLAVNEGKLEEPGGREVRFENRGKYTITILNLLGGRYHLHALSDDRKDWAFPFWDYPEQFKLIYSDEKYQIYENLKAFPRVFLAYDYKIAQDPQKILDLMFDPQIDLQKTLILEEDPNLLRVDSERGKVRVLTYSPGKIRITVKTGNPALLFLSDNYYPGWQALVDGQLTKIYRADYSFRAVKIPGGEHQVEFIYQPESFKRGVAISGISLLMMLTVFLMLKK